MSLLGPLLAFLLLACGDGERPPRAEGAPRPAKAPGGPVVEGGPRFVLLLVLDTVRADHTSLCGYERPTTPVLDRLVRERAFAWTCDMVAPGTWTLPSHASFFTGRDPLDHGLLSKSRPLAPEVETIAEVYGGKGWRTAIFSANPTLNASSGILQGFDRTAIAPGLYANWRGDAFEGRFDEFVDGLPTDRPIFLVVNLFDAHDPYPAVPEAVAWLPARPKVDVNLKYARNTPVGQYLLGKLTPEQDAEFVELLRDTYDYGVSLADRNVGKVLGALKRKGFLERGYRVVITSDHGENLGEHRSVRHDGPPWESVVRVPLIVIDDAVEKPMPLPKPLSGLVVHDLLTTGVVPSAPPVPASYAIAHLKERTWRQDSVALWDTSGGKLFWKSGERARYDLAADPGEEHPLEVGAHALVPLLDERVQVLGEVRGAIAASGEDGAMKTALEAIGYVE